MSSADSIDMAAALLRDADGLLIAAGAGMGVDSGLPDFRGNEGFWKAYPALAKQGLILPRSPILKPFDKTRD
jgi:NAD-dependent SIR2 family protein deacetylase